MRSGQVQYEEDLTPLMVSIEKVKQHGDNYNQGDVDAITESIVTNGMYRPIYVSRESQEIIAGNHTYLAVLGLGAEQVPVIWVDGNSEESVRKMLADNKTASLARPDISQELALLQRLQESDLGLIGTGYREQEIEQLKILNDMKYEPAGDFASWPSLCFQIPPHVKNAFQEMTDNAVGDRERFELMMRMAGWQG